MYHSVVLVALAGLIAHSSIEEPSWMKNYDAARKEAYERAKPLAVVVGSGVSGWNKLADEGQLGREAKHLLAKDYVCLYVDTEHIAGQKLADALEIEQAVGIVITDRTGRVQAFRHQGELGNEDLAHYLRRYGNPEYVVQRTEVTDSEYRRYYPEENAEPSGRKYTQPVFYPAFSGGGGGGC